ncbi:hypothetical protein [Leptolyngbya sp. FACHB-261]|nr:hypothetical protein [Leptolyngbya sp. FACHB-261]MBD2101076.1 hypothetical protein [Leptolyngbya sp. FACHB-261]
MAGDRERILAAGCKGYLRKPYVPEEVDAVINRVLRHFYTVPSSYRQAS